MIHADFISRPLFLFRAVCAGLSLAVVGTSAVLAADAFEETVRPFVENHCVECHDASSARAGFRIDTLGSDFTLGNTAGVWKAVMDKINSGQMPPKSEPRPDAKEAFAVASWIARKLHETELAAQGAGGRVPMRRMNRVEYANTVRDLFSLDDNFARRIEKELPADGKVGGFDRGAASLFMDEGQLDQYLAVADLLLDEAVFNEKPKFQHFTYDSVREKTQMYPDAVSYRKPSGEMVQENVSPEFAASLKEPLTMIPIQGFQQWDSKEKRYVPHGPFYWSIKNDGIEYLSGSPSYRRPDNRAPYFPGDWASKGVTRDGWYKFRIQAGAFRGEGKEAQKEVRLILEYCLGTPIEALYSQVVDAPLDAPKEYEFLMYLQTKPGMSRSWRIGWDNGNKDVIITNPLYQDVQWKPITIGDQLIRARSEKKPAEEIERLKKESETATAAALENRKTFQGPFWIYDPKLDLVKRPRLWVGKMEWKGPIVEWPPKGRKAIFFAGEKREDDGYVHEIFAKFLPLAYRRPATPEELDRVVNWTLKTKADRGLSFTNAVREGIKNVLCSPKFLYLGSEAVSSAAPSATDSQVSAKASAGPHPIDDWQLASRLSYLLWSSTPDEELYRLASQQDLRDPAILRTQVKRMIADPKAWEFARSFAGQWLSVRNFDNGNPPNRDFYRDYDDALRDSSKREPLEFFNAVLQHDLPVTNFLDSDFLMVNERLAKHYGIAGVEGDQFRRVPAPADGRRGGVLGMCGILTYLADGTRTLPVRRATWVLDALWNQPVPPPPPNVGNLPGSKEKHLSVRARLEMHRHTESCGSCHARVDPFGMALENYDAIGAWRDRQNGEGMRGDAGSPALDVSGALPDATEFKAVQEYKAALLAHKQPFIKGFTEKLLCYALGRPITYGDHVTVDQITTEAAKHEYQLQEIIQATVASTLFRTR